MIHMRPRKFPDRAVGASLKPKLVEGGIAQGRPIPRPRGRGLIEAAQTRLELQTARQFPDRAVGASLKPQIAAQFIRSFSEFPDRAVGASLKPVARSTYHPLRVQFPDRAVGASLKP